MTRACSDATFNSSHGFILRWMTRSIFAKHAFDTADVRGMNRGSAAQLTFALGGHLGEDMALERALAFETRSGFLDALGRTTVYFHFRHCRTALDPVSTKTGLSLINSGSSLPHF